MDKVRSTERFHGIFPALLTPFDKSGGVNEASLRQLVRFLLGKGVDGFYACGSTAEAFMLTLDQRKRILEVITAENNGQGAVIAHIGCINQAHAIELARHAEATGADAISSVPPFYYGFGFESLHRYYLALADAVSVPVLIYNYPASSGVTMTLEQIGQLLGDERFLGVKHTSSDFFQMEQFKAIRPDAVVYNGYDEMFLSGLAAGADGGIGSTFNMMPEKFIAMRRLFTEGNIPAAQALQREANRIIRVLGRVGVFPAEKAALTMLGVDMGECLKPFPSLGEEELALVRQALAENGCL